MLSHESSWKAWMLFEDRTKTSEKTGVEGEVFFFERGKGMWMKVDTAFTAHKQYFSRK